jgi:hypothetical protein
MPLYNNPNTDWNPITETFTYASATSITVVTGAASRWVAGDKFQFTQHGVLKNFCVLIVADTLLTIIGETASIVVENTGTYPITGIQYSRLENPIGFPKYFVWTPVITAYSGTPTTVTSALKLIVKGSSIIMGGLVTVVDKGSASAFMKISTPIVSAVAAAGGGIEGGATGKSCSISMTTSGSTVDVNLYDATTPWVNGYAIRFSIIYFY